MKTIIGEQEKFETELLKNKKCEFIFPLQDKNNATQFVLDHTTDDDLVLEGSIGFKNKKTSFTSDIFLCVFMNTEYNNLESLEEKHIKEMINRYTSWIGGERSIGNFANNVTLLTNLAINLPSSKVNEYKDFYGFKIERISAPYF